MKRYMITITMLGLILLLGSCSNSVSPAVTSGGSFSPGAPTVVVMPTPSDTVLSSASPAASGDQQGQPSDINNDDGDETPPPQTPWAEPAKIEYTGKYGDVATDKNAKSYPKLAVSKSVQTAMGTLKIPEKWSVRDGEDGTVLFVDEKSRVVGMLYQINSYKTEPFFGLVQIDTVMINWEKPKGFTDDVRAMVLESDYPTAADGSKKTIINNVCFLSNDANTDDDGLVYYAALCLSLDKAYVDGSKIEYVISNKTIDEIAKSLEVGLAK